LPHPRSTIGTQWRQLFSLYMKMTLQSSHSMFAVFFSNPECFPKFIWLWTVLYILLLLLQAWRICQHSRCFSKIGIVNHNKFRIQFNGMLTLYWERILLCALSYVFFLLQGHPVYTFGVGLSTFDKASVRFNFYDYILKQLV
jgi:hypothetical protein